MKRVKKPVFFIVAVLILALAFTSVCGVYTQNGDTKNTWIKGVGDIRWGIDIRGGVEATFSPADGVDATPEQLESAKAIIELRMVSKSITDYEIYTDEANDKIIVRFPWKSGETDFDPEKAIIVGDSLSSDIQGGINAGIKTCWVNPEGLPCREDIRPDYEIQYLHQLEALLETLNT